jgi:hypothetical protein
MASACRVAGESPFDKILQKRPFPVREKRHALGSRFPFQDVSRHRRPLSCLAFRRSKSRRRHVRCRDPLLFVDVQVLDRDVALSWGDIGFPNRDVRFFTSMAAF